MEFVFAAIGFVVLYVSFARLSSYPEFSESMLLKCGDSDSPGVDIVGWMLLVLAVAVPIISLTLGDNFLEWSNPVEIALLISGPIFVFLFIGFESKFTTTPVLDMKPVFHPGFLRVLVQVFGYTFILNSVWHLVSC